MRVVHSLMTAMGNTDHSNSQRLASLTLEVLGLGWARGRLQGMAVKAADPHTVLPHCPLSAAVLCAAVPIGGGACPQGHGRGTLPALPCKYLHPHQPQQLPPLSSPPPTVLRMNLVS